MTEGTAILKQGPQVLTRACTPCAKLAAPLIWQGGEDTAVALRIQSKSLSRLPGQVLGRGSASLTPPLGVLGKIDEGSWCPAINSAKGVLNQPAGEPVLWQGWEGVGMK